METTTLALLRRVPIFAGLSEALLQNLAQHSRRRHFRAQEALFHESDPGYTLYIVISGQVTIQTSLPSGGIVTHARRGPSEHFGELALIDGKPRMADAVTAVESELLMLDRQEFLRCVEASPQMALSIMANLADRLRETARLKETQQELDVPGRVAEALMNLATTHGEAHASGGVLITARLTQEQLANQIGATRESVNRALSNLKAAKIICNEGRKWIVLNTAKLKQRCQI